MVRCRKSASVDDGVASIDGESGRVSMLRPVPRLTRQLIGRP